MAVSKATHQKRIQQFIAILALIGAWTVTINIWTATSSAVHHASAWIHSLSIEIPTIVSAK